MHKSHDSCLKVLPGCLTSECNIKSYGKEERMYPSSDYTKPAL